MSNTTLIWKSFLWIGIDNLGGAISVHCWGGRQIIADRGIKSRRENYENGQLKNNSIVSERECVPNRGNLCLKIFLKKKERQHMKPFQIIGPFYSINNREEIKPFGTWYSSTSFQWPNICNALPGLWRSRVCSGFHRLTWRLRWD